MTHLRNAGAAAGLSCLCCAPSLSRRKFLCTSAAGAIAASTAFGAAVTPARAQQPPAGRPILIKGGCVLSLDRAVGDF
jgi:5-methylthioadenosine/S-adenosylhomocysteine deaminase